MHVNGNLSKEKAFFELLKLIFCKVYDEQRNQWRIAIHITQDERRSDLGQRKLKTRIEKLFNAVKRHYPYIFPRRVTTSSLITVPFYTVAELQKFNFQETKSDIKGEAYRGDRECYEPS